MTEAQWLACADPQKMLGSVQRSKRFQVSERKLRLFACACCRHVWQVMDSRCRETTEMAERFADGVITLEQLIIISENSDRVALEIERAGPTSPSAGAARAAAWAARPRGRIAMQSAHAAWWAEVRARETEARILANQAMLLRDIFGNLFRPVTLDPAWLTSTVTVLAEGIYADRAFDRLPILADALMDAGCGNADILAHCRSEGPHVRGCWPVDLLLGKE